MHMHGRVDPHFKFEDKKLPIYCNALAKLLYSLNFSEG